MPSFPSRTDWGLRARGSGKGQDPQKLHANTPYRHTPSESAQDKLDIPASTIVGAAGHEVNG